METQDPTARTDAAGATLSPQAAEAAQGMPDGTPEEVAGARVPDVKMSTAEERSALQWFLGATQRLEYEVPFDWATPAGFMRMRLRFRQMDPGKLDEIDAAHRKGDGPFAKLDVPMFNAAVVAEAGVYLVDEAGGKVALDSPDFLGGAPSPELAVYLRFKYQGGILDQIVEQVRAVSGYSPDRVGTASRVLVDAAKGS